jgi:hypothetical protein
MKRRFTTFLAVAALVLALAAPALAIDANDPDATWVVTGLICGVPNTPRCVTFSCSVDVAHPTCNVGVNSLSVQFSAPDTTSFGLVFLPVRVCSAASCAPVDVTTDAAPAADTVAGTTTLTAAQTLRLYFPNSCEPCFNGLMPSFTFMWSATATSSTTTTTAAPTTTTTTTVTTTTTTTTTTT